MIRFFRQSYVIQYVVIALLGLAIWVPSFITGNVDVAWRSPVTPLYNLVANVLDFWPPAMLLFALLLMAFSTMFFNSILAANQIITKVSTMGAVMSLLMMNLLPTQTTCYPFLLALPLVLLFVNTFFVTYQTPNPELYLLNAGVFLSLATMCYFPLLLLTIWGVIALSLLHKGSLRLHLIPVVGFLFPYFVYFAGHFLAGDLLQVWQSYGTFFSEIRLSIAGFNLLNVIMLSFLLLMSLAPVLMPQLYDFDKSIAVRTKMKMIVILLLFGLLLLFLDVDPMRTGVLFLSFSFVFSYQFSYLEKLKISNITFLVLVLAVLFLHYYPIFA